MRKNNKLLIDVKPINLEMGDYLCFSNFEALNKRENFEYIKNFTMEDSAGQVGGFYCYHPSSRSIVVYLVYCFPNELS